jgi:hypothetical protein
MEENKKNELLTECVKNGVHTLEIISRTGPAKEPETLIEPERLYIKGAIDTVRKFIEQRADTFESNVAHLSVDRYDGLLSLVIDETSPLAGKVVGALEIDPDYEAFGINTVARKPRDLSKFLRFNQQFFSSRAIAGKIVTALHNFEATINTEIEKKDDNRANTSAVKKQVVDSNIPENFTINIPLIDGQPKVELTIDIDIDPDGFDCTLICDTSKEKVRAAISKCINEELKAIVLLDPKLLIVEK